MTKKDQCIYETSPVCRPDGDGGHPVITTETKSLIRRALRAEADVTALREAFRAGFMAHLVAPDPAETDPLKILDERNRWRFDGNQIAGDKEPMAFEAWTLQSAALTATEDQQMENTTMPCQKCGSTDGWSGPTYRRQLDHGFISRGYIRWPRVIAETLDWACVRCGYTRHTRTVDHDEEANTLPARRPDSMTRGVDATPPAAPPNTTIYHGSFFSRCFWFGHSYRWRLLEGDWIQQQCEHCPSTGDTQRCYKPAPPPPPPPWMDPNDQVRS